MTKPDSNTLHKYKPRAEKCDVKPQKRAKFIEEITLNPKKKQTN